MQRPIALIEAPSNLGLRPLRPGHVPGAWRAPEALAAAGLRDGLKPAVVTTLARPPYSPDRQPGTSLLNGPELRRFNEQVADAVDAAFSANQFAFVLGGDCSVLIGALAGARKHSELSLVHIDGHSDFRHPGNYDAANVVGTAAGMDLALATGRGEPLMTEWPGVPGPLVPDERVVQIGEREGNEPDFAWPDVNQSGITRLDIFEVRERGVDWTIQRTREVLDRAALPFWVHLDVDVLDQAYMPAVDCPGSPGLDPAELTRLIAALIGDARAIGLTLCIYDPDLDPDGAYARTLVAIVAEAFANLAAPV